MRIKTILLMLILLLFSSCSNYKELNNVGIVVGMGIEYIPIENQYEVTFEIINPSAVATQIGSQGVPALAGTEKGRTISEAARKVTKKFSRTNIYSQVQLIVIGEKLAKEKSINFIFDVFERDSKIRVNIPVVIARGSTVTDLLENIPSLDKFPPQSIIGKLDNYSNLLGANQITVMHEVITNLSSKGKDPVISGVTLEDKKPSHVSLDNTTTLDASYDIINGLGIFHQGKLVGWMDDPNSRSVQMINNNIKETNIQVKCDKKNVFDSMVLFRFRSKVDIKMIKNVPHINIKVTTIGHFDEVLCNDSLDRASILTKYEKKGEKEIKKIILGGIKDSQKLGADVFGFGDKFHTSNPKEFNKYVKDVSKWDDLYKKAVVKVDVQYTINNVGMRKKPYPY